MTLLPTKTTGLGKLRAQLSETAPTWSAITLTATAMRATASRSRSAWVVRTSAASACSERSRRAYPPSQPIPNSSGMKISPLVE